MHDDALASAIAAAFRKHVLDECVPRVRSCVESLTAEQCWQRPGQHGNSIANLLMHLAGNVRQWILCGIRGDDDRRARDLEFAAGSADAESVGMLMDRLEATAREAAEVVESLTPQQLVARYRFQGRYNETGVGGVLHVLEHFSGHAYQIYAHTKRLQNSDLRFYDL